MHVPGLAGRVMSTRRWSRRPGVLALSLLAVLLGAAGIGTVRSVSWFVAERTGTAAQARFGGSRTEALVAMAQAPDVPLKSRNRAIWALGESGETRALPALLALDDGRDCDHTRRVCQHEVRKAIGKLRGERGFNASVRRALAKVTSWLR